MSRVGVSSGQYIFAPALRDYFKKLPQEVDKIPAEPLKPAKPVSRDWTEIWKHVSSDNSPAGKTSQDIQKSSNELTSRMLGTGDSTLQHQSTSAAKDNS